MLVTGAGRGLGRELAVAFARQGAFVAANDLTPVNLDRTLEEMRATAGDNSAREFLFDVAFQLQCRAMVAEVVSELGRLDVLVNAARVMPKAHVLDMDEWDWRRTMDVNLGAGFFLTQTAGRVMADQGGGVIVNFSATAGERDETSAQHGSGYAAFRASQAGLIALTRAAADELAPNGVRVYLITSSDSSGREEVVKKTLYLCSDSSGHLEECVHHVDKE